ncbi:hypothetical protein ACFPOI_34375 [Nonomuraea angiospora]|uniref:Uncharacterized protein n=1 Tax=Nonomuraea angiospora TaxID=46172 RepID=A0ABR9LV14_9ACTN|nr:hypothetical protein [Nonomuraea angiospora]MBE1583931.1 hypothetical protein [Nonomuraea angiospora]
MRNKIMRVLVPAAALAMAVTAGAGVPASAEVKVGYIKSVHRTLAQCEAAGWKYSGDHEYWDCDWDSPFWALWVLK